MRPTITFLKEKYQYFNELCFNNSLPDITIRLSRSRTTGGNLRYRYTKNAFGVKNFTNPVISISIIYDLPQNVVEDVLIHEMIHYHILVNHLKDTSTHGDIFRGEMERINIVYGRNVTVSLRQVGIDYSQDTQQKIHFVCVFKHKDGRIMFAPTTKGSLRTLWKKIETATAITEYKWYVTGNPYFNRYRHVRTLKAYLTVPDIIMPQLSEAPRLFYIDGEFVLKEQDQV